MYSIQKLRDTEKINTRNVRCHRSLSTNNNRSGTLSPMDQSYLSERDALLFAGDLPRVATRARALRMGFLGLLLKFEMACLWRWVEVGAWKLDDVFEWI